MCRVAKLPYVGTLCMALRELSCARQHRLAPLKRTMRSSTAFVLLLAGSTARGARNGLDLVPPMGWSNWENSGCNVNETYVRASAQALIDKGLFEVGYDIVEVDGSFLLVLSLAVRPILSDPTDC